MQLSDAFWQVFATTGHLGAYLLYRTYAADDSINTAGDEPVLEEGEEDPLSFAIGGNP
ncbi:MAG: YqzL family protein [Firmicutes bacterium]|nr:YqzL family protein [Bacillota bacterium]